jgi:hypothetical protein
VAFTDVPAAALGRVTRHAIDSGVGREHDIDIEDAMMDSVKAIPEGVPVVMPMLVCRDASAAIDFCKSTFNAVELVRRPGPDGNVAHAALTIGGAMIMIEAEWPTLCEPRSAAGRQLTGGDLRLCRRRG